MTIGEAMKSWRENANLTQKEVADILDLTSQYISKIEKNLVCIPVKHFKTISELYEIDLSKIVDIHIEKIKQDYWRRLDQCQIQKKLQKQIRQLKERKL